MTRDPFPSTDPADHDTRPTAGPAPVPDPGFAGPASPPVTAHDTPEDPDAAPARTPVAVAVADEAPGPAATGTPAGADSPEHGGAPAPDRRPAEADATADARTDSDSAAAPEANAEANADSGDKDHEDDDEPIRTVLRTAATERPLEEVAALVARLQRTGEVTGPADVALRAAAVSRPLEEVRRLVALLNASGEDVQQADTTLRAAAVGRPVDDVVQLVNILGSDSGDWRTPGSTPPASSDPDGGRDGNGARRKLSRRERAEHRAATQWSTSALNSALAAGPGGHSVSPALRSVLRWPAALALFVCGAIHLPTDLPALRSGGYGELLSVAVLLLCLLCAVWLATRDTATVWAATAGLAVGIIALHALAGAGTVDLLNSSLGDTFTWAKAAAVLSGAATVLLAGAALFRGGRAGVPKST
ncbi:hypothetical protein [Streptomyces sp. NPDC005805]|uniref:hypothetical protein n=1 Tax=Streptomyces sp. NPDC005805 TaxID=3157068 RepID=UPI0033FB384B